MQADWEQDDSTAVDYIKNKPTIPSKTSDLTNDSGFLTSETDPTVPAWAKQESKPTYTAQEVGALPANTPIPSEVTESTVSGWGFTKNTGTYSKPQGGIPKTDLASDVQTSLGKADNAIQKAAQGTTGLLKPDGTVDNSTYLTQHQDISGKVNTSDLSNVAFSGDYDDLENKPTIPTLPTLATVATSGSYNDLLNKPTIPAAQIQSDWNQQDSSSADYIKNKPTIPSSSGDVNVIEEVQVNGVALTPDTNKAVNVQVPIISTDVSADASSDAKTASPKAVKDYVDSICGAILTRLQGI